MRSCRCVVLIHLPYFMLPLRFSVEHAGARHQFESLPGYAQSMEPVSLTSHPFLDPKYQSQSTIAAADTLHGSRSKSQEIICDQIGPSPVPAVRVEPSSRAPAFLTSQMDQGLASSKETSGMTIRERHFLKSEFRSCCRGFC